MYYVKLEFLVAMLFLMTLSTLLELDARYFLMKFLLSFGAIFRQRKVLFFFFVNKKRGNT